jgi:hypothetical protein
VTTQLWVSYGRYRPGGNVLEFPLTHAATALLRSRPQSFYEQLERTQGSKQTAGTSATKSTLDEMLDGTAPESLHGSQILLPG